MNILIRWFRFVGARFSTVLLCIPALLLTSIASADDPLSADRPIRLYAAAAQITGVGRFEKREDWLAIEGESTTTWMATIDREGEYRALIVYSGDTPAAPFTLALGDTVVNGTLAVQTGVFDDPLINFGRMIVIDNTRLPRGSLQVQLRIPNGKAQLRIRSIDIERMPTAEAAVQERKIAQERASTDWLARAAYGVMFHWTSESTPRHGPALPYQRAVDAFDVAAFAEMVENTGARYVIFTANHAQPHCPAPIVSWERIHPGSTTKRDLLGEIAQALEARNIKLMLYFASHTVGRLRVSTGAEYLRIHKEILQEIGQRYGARVAGYWFDGWYQTLEAYPEIDLHDLLPFVRAGNPARLVAFNSWVYPVETPWQDYWAGEVGDVVRPATSRYITSGTAIGLQSHFLLFADAPWVHSLTEAEMEPLRFSDESLIDFVRKNAESEAAVTINLGIYQDGSIGEAARRQMAALRQAIRGE
jgi:alpha-L-fucosidase-like protein